LNLTGRGSILYKVAKSPFYDDYPYPLFRPQKSNWDPYFL